MFLDPRFGFEIDDIGFRFRRFRSRRKDGRGGGGGGGGWGRGVSPTEEE